MDTYVYKRVGDCDIKADVYPVDSTALAPVIIWIHGGALIGGGRGGLHPALRERFERAGYVQVSIDYRLAPETKLPQILEDVGDAFQWIRERGAKLFGADGRRVGVIGHSAGGYLSLVSGYMIRPRPRAIASFYGYGDIIGKWYSEPDPYYCSKPMVTKAQAYGSVGSHVLSDETGQKNRFMFYLYCRQNGLWPKEVTGADPRFELEKFTNWCPILNIDVKYPPTLLAHGTADTDVPYELSAAMAAKLGRHGVEHEFVTIPDGGHGFDRLVQSEHLDSEQPSIAAQSLLRALAFLNKHV